ncbi:M14 family metallopeptidase [Opitutaceae bacterium]
MNNTTPFARSLSGFGGRLLAVALLAASFVSTPAGAQALPQTWQEKNNFRSGPTPFEPLMEFWYELARISPEVHIKPLTRTLLGRELTLVTLSKERVLTPQDALRSGKTIVLIGSSVHGGETAGKEAAQLVAKQLLAGDLRSALDDVIVLFIPLLNPDGGEVTRRTNEQGFDMNRDYIKLESQEIRALVTQVMNEWTPDIHVDAHHGGADPYTITWQATLNPAADAELRAFPYSEIFPRIRAALRARDYDGFDYSGPRTVNGARAWGSTSLEARKHHVYTGLTNSIGILTETPRNGVRVMRDGTLKQIPEEERYFHQVQGQVIAMSEILRVAAEKRTQIRAVTTGARLRAIANGTKGGDPIVLQHEVVSRGTEPVWMPDGEAPGGYVLLNVPVYLQGRPTKTTTRPLGYILPASMGNVLPRLFDHDIAVYRFTSPASLNVEAYDATKVKQAEYFQGHYLMKVEVERSNQKVDVPAGWYWIPTAQSRANLISELLEPESNDNIITWGWANHLLQVTPDSVEQAETTLLEAVEGAALTDAQRAQIQARARMEMDRKQRVPMLRVVSEQPMPVLRVTPYNSYDRNRYFELYR